MDLVIYDVNIVYYHMNPLWSVVLGQSYFAHPNYLVIHCLILAISLHSTIITQAGALNIWRYVQQFEGVTGYMPNGAPDSALLSYFIASFQTSQSYILFLKHHFRVLSPSIGNMYISAVRWVSFCFCSRVMPSLWGLWLTHPDLVWITLGPLSGSLCGMFVFLSYLVFHSGNCGVIHHCIVLLWFHTVLLHLCT